MLGSVDGAALSVDASDPNAATPQASRVSATSHAHEKQLVGSFIADAGCVLELWVFSKKANRWLRVANPTIATAFVAVVVSNIPENMPAFLRVQANAGGAKVAAVIFH